MDGTAVVEGNAKVQALFEEIMGIDNKRKHITIRNKYAVGIVRKFREIFIYDYDRSSRPLVKVKKAGQTVLLRLGFGIDETLELLENLLRIMQAFGTPKEEPIVHLPKPIPVDDPRSTVGINEAGKIIMHSITAIKRPIAQ
jgi:hypothetical protein